MKEYIDEDGKSHPIKNCPFCDSNEITIEPYDFGREYGDSLFDVDADTEAIVFSCKCGCSLSVNVVDPLFPEEKIIHAIDVWNRRRNND